MAIDPLRAPKKFKMPKVPHLVRYSLIFSGAIFAANWKQVSPDITLIFMAPIIVIAHTIKTKLDAYLPMSNDTASLMFKYLLPITIFYYAFISFLMKQLLNERGPIRWLSMIGLLGFLGYIHYVAFNYLIGFTRA